MAVIEERKKNTYKRKDPLISRNNQPVRDDERRNIEAITSTLEPHGLVSITFASASELCPENHCIVGFRMLVVIWFLVEFIQHFCNGNVCGSSFVFHGSLKLSTYVIVRFSKK